jgi:hypothetical protein
MICISSSKNVMLPEAKQACPEACGELFEPSAEAKSLGSRAQGAF